MAVLLRPISALEPVGNGTVQVKNGESLQLLVRSNGSGLVTRATIPAAERLVMGIPLDIDAVSEADLEKISVIGTELARGIVLCRQNCGGSMKVHELLSVEGIGEKKFYSLRKFF